MTDLTNLFESITTQGYEILRSKPLAGKIPKYIYELSGSGKIKQRKIGTAKLCFLAKDSKKRGKR